MTKLKNLKEKPLIGQTKDELKLLVQSLGHRSFRGEQLFDWLYRKQIYDYNKMSDLPISFREQLKHFTVHPLDIIHNNFSLSKQTQKFLFKLKNNKTIESVLMEENERVTVCISTQVGCAVDCDFCATAKMGFIQNLTQGEIVDQFIQLQNFCRKKITNVVFMGMGEPFLNYKNTLGAAHLLHDPNGINMGAWRITISTAGIIKKIKKFTVDKEPFKLAISLNGTSEEQRSKTMPINKTQSLSKLIQASEGYTQYSRKKVTFEYVLLAGINDDPNDAKKLQYILSPINCKLNIIPYNDISSSYKRPRDSAIRLFVQTLAKAPFPVTVRWSKGHDINAGCGQLARMSE